MSNFNLLDLIPEDSILAKQVNHVPLLPRETTLMLVFEILRSFLLNEEPYRAIGINNAGEPDEDAEGDFFAGMLVDEPDVAEEEAESLIDGINEAYSLDLTVEELAELVKAVARVISDFGTMLEETRRWHVRRA